MNKAQLGSITLGKQPHIIGSLETPVPVQTLQELHKMGMHCLECRVDLFNTPLEKTISYLDSVHALGLFGLLGTLRETAQNQHNRIQQFQDLIPHIDGLDIEIDTPIRDTVIAMGIEAKKTVMVSFHDYQSTPSTKELETLLNEAIKAKAAIVKLAVMANSPEDVTRLLNFIHQNNQHPLIAIAMGPWGSLSRVAAPLFGSLLSYGYITESVAPGQLSAIDLTKAFKTYYPSFI